ncbi:hypothetical protein [Domibacillus iocasae]|uniref:Uncharacterized protein n=1 Tax=Domibacillus iocasae TaxID=1714016 RepID=A0A1E7DLD9_9BACI|nr:hypothetical protein [Domibacillus iocasae]OES43890.1 hypothetical protein BA724_12425 [Domibacillus iocasae]
MVGTFILNNLLAVLWIALFVKTKKENRLQITHFLFLLIAIGILVHSCAAAFSPYYGMGIQISKYEFFL